jgi:hypothetical protein
MLPTMVRQKSRLMRVKLPPATDDALGKVAAALKLDRSSALRFIVMGKARELGLPLSIDAELDAETPLAPAPVKPLKPQRRR